MSSAGSALPPPVSSATSATVEWEDHTKQDAVNVTFKVGNEIRAYVVKVPNGSEKTIQEVYKTFKENFAAGNDLKQTLEYFQKASQEGPSRLSCVYTNGQVKFYEANSNKLMHLIGKVNGAAARTGLGGDLSIEDARSSSSVAGSNSAPASAPLADAGRPAAHAGSALFIPSTKFKIGDAPHAELSSLIEREDNDNVSSLAENIDNILTALEALNSIILFTGRGTDAADVNNGLTKIDELFNQIDPANLGKEMSKEDKEILAKNFKLAENGRKHWSAPVVAGPASPALPNLPLQNFDEPSKEIDNINAYLNELKGLAISPVQLTHLLVECGNRLDGLQEKNNDENLKFNIEITRSQIQNLLPEEDSDSEDELADR